MARTPLNDAEILERLSKLDGWERTGDQITKIFQLDSYLAGLAFATTIGTIAEGFDHHPDLHIGWRKVTVSFTTHDAGNKLTKIDFDIAESIDAIPYP